MRDIVRASVILGVIALPASAEALESLRDDQARGSAILQSGSVAALAAKPVMVGGRAAPIKDLADQGLASHRRLDAELRASRAALLADPVVTEEIVETGGVVILESKTSFTVVDPVRLRQSAPRFRNMQSTAGRGSFDVAKLSTAEKQEWAALKASVMTKPATHPLRQALVKGESDFIDAIAAGKGDFSVTSSIVVPKMSPKLKGTKLVGPAITNGHFDYGTESSFELPIGLQGETLGAAAKTITGGTQTFEAKFLTGFTRSDGLEFEEKWEFPGGFFRLGAGLTYAIGLRVPVTVTGVMDPAKTTTSAVFDQALTYKTTLSANTLNAGESFYTDVGLSKKDAYDGKELVLEGGPYVSIKLKRLGVYLVDTRIPEGPLFDFGENFKPPFGDCGTQCGFDVWLPSSVTRTGFKVLMVEGAVQFGVNVGGGGEVKVSYLALKSGPVAFDSIFQGKSAHGHTLTLGPSSATLSAVLAGGQEGATNFGYRLYSPSYTWNLVLTPRVKGTIKVNAKPFFQIDEEIGPFDLPPKISLGSLNLGAHSGTIGSYDVLNGVKTFVRTGKAGR